MVKPKIQGFFVRKEGIFDFKEVKRGREMRCVKINREGQQDLKSLNNYSFADS